MRRTLDGSVYVIINRLWMWAMWEIRGNSSLSMELVPVSAGFVSRCFGLRYLQWIIPWFIPIDSVRSKLSCQLFFFLILFFVFSQPQNKKVGYELSAASEASSSCFRSVCLISRAVLKPVLMSYNRWGTHVIVSSVWRWTLTSPRCRYSFCKVHFCFL